MTGKPRVSFLLGSGISLPAGLCNVNEITKRILFSLDFKWQNNFSYLGPRGCKRKRENQSKTDSPPEIDMGNRVKRVQKFLNLLTLILTGQYKGCDYFVTYKDIKDQVVTDGMIFLNYEELYYIVSQLSDHLRDELHNPAIQPFLHRINRVVRPILKDAKYVSVHVYKWELKELVKHAQRFIKDAVKDSLQVDDPDLGYFSFFSDAIADNRIDLAAIFTLNHDTLLENYLHQKHVAFDDGFGNSVNEVRYWRDDAFQGHTGVIPFLKLHGSIDWYRFIESGRYGNIIKGDRDDTLDEHGNKQTTDIESPVFLSGTLNKLGSYTRHIYSDLFFNFRRLLKQADILIVSGYGFGDKGINNQIADWFTPNCKKRVILIHEDPNTASLNNSRLGN